MAINVSGSNVGGEAPLKIWRGSATTDAQGNFSVDYSAAGFADVPDVFVVGVVNAAAATDKVWATVTTRTSTGATGSALRGLVMLVLGASVRVAAAGATVSVLAVGTPAG